MLWLGQPRQEALVWFSCFLTSERAECSGLAGPVLTDLGTSALLWPAQHLHSFGVASLISFLLMMLSACPIIPRWPISYSTLNIAYFWTKREHPDTLQYPDLDTLVACLPALTAGSPSAMVWTQAHSLHGQQAFLACFLLLKTSCDDLLDHFMKTTGPCTVWGAKVATTLCYSILTKCRSPVP